jgi:hypothetical protein
LNLVKLENFSQPLLMNFSGTTHPTISYSYSSPIPPHRKSSCNFSIRLATLAERGNKDIK